MNKNGYKDIDRYAITKRKQQKRWRERSGAFMHDRRRWSDAEIELLLDQSISDRELADKIERSVGAIYTKRSRLRGIENVDT